MYWLQVATKIEICLKNISLTMVNKTFRYMNCFARHGQLIKCIYSYVRNVFTSLFDHLSD